MMRNIKIGAIIGAITVLLGKFINMDIPAVFFFGVLVGASIVIIYFHKLSKDKMSKEDWRWMFLEECLMDVELQYISNYKPFSESWEHENCCFCNQKISQYKGDANSVYCTTDDKQCYWICDECYQEFKIEFNWKLIE